MEKQTNDFKQHQLPPPAAAQQQIDYRKILCGKSLWKRSGQSRKQCRVNRRQLVRHRVPGAVILSSPCCCLYRGRTHCWQPDGTIAAIGSILRSFVTPTVIDDSSTHKSLSWANKPGRDAPYLLRCLYQILILAAYWLASDRKHKQ